VFSKIISDIDDHSTDQNDTSSSFPFSVFLNLLEVPYFALPILLIVLGVAICAMLVLSRHKSRGFLNILFARSSQAGHETEPVQDQNDPLGRIPAKG
jgi:hypothetical protein